MIGNRIKELRVDKGLSLEELGNKVGKSASTISRYENNITTKFDPKLLKELANALESSSAYLLGVTDNPVLGKVDDEIEEYTFENDLTNIVVRDEDMAPDIPYGAIVKIRRVNPNEMLQIGGFYYIEFGDKKGFRVVVDSHEDGIGFMPDDISERRIAFDPEYVTIIGKAVSMKVLFEDEVEYE